MSENSERCITSLVDLLLAQLESGAITKALHEMHNRDTPQCLPQYRRVFWSFFYRFQAIGRKFQVGVV
jgi:hypothetical protein